MFDLARTPAALFRQMASAGRTIDEMELVRRGYDFGAALSSGRFEMDGGPIQVHGIGTASVLVHLGAPAYMIAAATFHNGYTTGDWGDGRGEGPHKSRRARVREALGAEAEEFLYAIHKNRLRGYSLTTLLETADDLDDRDRWIVLHGLADLLDKWEDGRVFYSDKGRRDREFVEGREAQLVELARRIAGEELASSFELAFARVADEEIPESLKIGRVYSVVIPPASYAKRRSLVLKRGARRLLGPARRKIVRAKV